MVVHPQTVTKAHLAACAAGKQNKFIAFYNAFWDKAFTPYSQTRDPSKLGEENIMALSKEIGLDTAKLKADMDGPECQKFVAADMAELSKFKVNATPAFFINGQFIGGALGKDAFKAIIDQKLAAAQASQVPAAQYYDQEIMGKGVKQFRSASDPK